jgi:hypothetical protein
MSTQLPKPIAAYIAASNARDAKAIAACFTDDAVVRYENHDRRGIADILEWKAWTEKKYQPIVEVLDSVETAGKTIVTCKVSGTFPGSPVELKYGVTLEGEKIARLEIVP